MAAIAMGVLTAGQARAAVITFNGANSNGQTYMSPSYQPLLNGTATDGGNLGVTIGWGSTWSATTAANPGVVDHTPGGNGTVAYDAGMQTFTMTFSSKVVLSSFYYSNYMGGTYSIDFKGYTNIDDTDAVVDVARNYTQAGPSMNGGYQWIQETGLAGYGITKFSISGGLYKQLDDLTIELASVPISAVAAAVPEPASMALLGLGVLAVGAIRRRSAR